MSDRKKRTDLLSSLPGEGEKERERNTETEKGRREEDRKL